MYDNSERVNHATTNSNVRTRKGRQRNTYNNDDAGSLMNMSDVVIQLILSVLVSEKEDTNLPVVCDLFCVYYPLVSQQV